MVVQQGKVADFAGKAGFSAEQLPVQDHAHAQSPAYVQEKDRPGVARDSAHIFAEGHAPGVVLDTNGPAESLFQDAPDGFFLADVIAVAVPGPVVDPAGEVHAHGADPGGVQVIFPQLFLHAGAQAEDRLFRAGQGEGDPVLELDQPAGEIRDGQREFVFPYLHAHEEACIRVKPVQARPASGGRFLLAPVGQDARLLHLADDARDLGYAGPQFMGEVREGVGVAILAEGENAFFLRRIAVFQQAVQERFHDCIESTQR